jgi:hypothetical protein
MHVNQCVQLEKAKFMSQIYSPLFGGLVFSTPLRPFFNLEGFFEATFFVVVDFVDLVDEAGEDEYAEVNLAFLAAARVSRRLDGVAPPCSTSSLSAGNPTALNILQ